MANTGGSDVLLHPTKGSDITKDVAQLIGKLDTIYELHSFLPQNPEKDLCVTYLQSGVCNAKCKFHHTLVSRPAVTSPSCPIHDLIYIFERAASLMKIVTHEATQDIANVIKPVCMILKNQFQVYIAEYSYGDVSYLYDECSLRVLANMRSFLNKKPSPKQYFKKVYNVKPPTNSVMDICIAELRIIRENFQNYENSFHQRTQESLVSPDVSSDTLNTLTSDLSSHAETAKALHDMHQTSLKSMLQKINSILESLWNTPTGEKSFEIVPCGLTSSALSITPHTSPLYFAISRDVKGDTMSRSQTLEAVAMALANNGFTVIENNKDKKIPQLTVVLSGQTSKEPQQEINFMLNDRLASLNSQLFSSYHTADNRVRPMVLAVQQWARVRGCCDPDNATLSLYGWTILVIFFLRQHADFSLPSLQQAGVLSAANVNPPANDEQISKDTNSTLTLAPLLIQFFSFYGTSSTSGFQPFHAIVTLRNDHKVFKRESHFATLNNNHSTVPCMTALEAVQAMCPEGDVKTRPELSGKLTVVPQVASDSEFGNEEDNDHTDREISSNTSHHSRRGGTARQHMLAYSVGIPSWRFCIEDPLEDVDVGAATFCRTGQAHMWNEMRRALSLFLEITDQNGGKSSDAASEQARRNYWQELCVPNCSIPQVAQMCSICGQEGHREHSCELLRCQLCSETGHFMRDCLLNFCSNCRKQGHFAKDCDLPKICRHCKQPGHIVKDCPHNVCAKCGSHKHITSRCYQKGSSNVKDKPHHHKRTKSNERTKSSDVNNVSAADIMSSEHEILPVGRNRFDSFDIDLSSLDSRASGGSSHASRRKKRLHHPHQKNNNQNSKGMAADGKDNRPPRRENKIVVPSFQIDYAQKSRMPWHSSSNAPRPQINIANTNNTFLKKKFFSSMYSPQSSPYASPRDYNPAATAPGKTSSKTPGAMVKPSQANRGAKPSQKNNNRPNANQPSRSRNRSRGGSISATVSAGYVSTGYSSASPRNYIPPSPISTPTAAATFHKADSKVDSTAYPKLPAKPQSLALQKKPLPPQAKAQARDRTYSVPGSPVRNMHDIKLSASGFNTESRNFTTPYDPDGHHQSSPDSFGAEKKKSHSIAEHKKENKKEKKRSNQRNYRRKQAKRVGNGGGRAAKPTLYIDDDVSETEGNFYIEEGNFYAKATMQSGFDQKADGRVIDSSGRYSYDKAEEKQGLTVEYADYLEYL